MKRPDLPPHWGYWGGRIWRVVGGVSVRTKILGMVLALVVLLGLAVTYQVRTMLTRTLREQLQQQSISVARDVAARSTDLVLTNDLYALHRLLQDTQQNNPDVRYAFVVDPAGLVLAHTFEGGFPPDLLAANPLPPDSAQQLQSLETDEGVVWDTAVPVFEGRAGVARVGLSERAMHRTLGNITQQLLVTTVAVSLAGVAGGIFLTWLITRPVLALVDVTRAVARGELAYKAPHWADDEIGLLSDSFNAMVNDLAAARAESEAYNAELLRRNRELAVLNEVARAVSRQQDLDEMLNVALDRVLGLMRMEAGWILLLEGEGAKPRLVCSQGIPALVARREAEMGFPDCRCGRVLEEKRPLCIAPLEKTCPVSGLCLADGQIVNGHATLPLISKSRVLGTLNIACVSPDCFSEEDLQLLGAIGRQLGVAVENARLWKEVQQKEAARGQLLEKIITAQEEERKRVARELHDGASQALTSLMVGLKVLEGLCSPGEIHAHLVNLRDVASETLETVHDLALELRPSVLDDVGLAAALDRYVVEYQRRFNIRVDCRSIGFEGRRLPPAIETALYRIVQEALTNVARHAEADHASVLLEWTSQHVRAIVEDNGNGFDTARAQRGRQLGLYGMEERATLIGGSLRIESQPGLGTTVVAHVPLSAVLALERMT